MKNASTRSLFATPLYEAKLKNAALVADLERSCHALAEDDRAGRSWSKAHGYRGYTSYASLNDLPMRDPAFADLVKLLNKHVAAFAEDCGFELDGGKLKLDSLWVNVMKPGGTHSGHIHPHSVISGTVYIAVPPGAGAIKFEDPRLPMMMAAPRRRDDVAEPLKTFVYVEPQAGSVLLWESWLRHEVAPGTAKTERVSISFNYRW
ncbi:TIGR02466 family protein [Sphingomonas sp. 10B4]|uniref:TIGR02466 family protein n=1 Tax=Sphingomonas sp. 10B4 TaxID=3048575 RepID=UPI002AB39833|nr:TIGR02466 family protein [Sphingomonas sp. 10B4]MDY7523034.1 TIGR02466 family protein [Sphingomonas sp. 10B4]MEB0282812.1 TIGR02466 family protein [Sphingomonas sp. 10B4]